MGHAYSLPTVHRIFFACMIMLIVNTYTLLSQSVRVSVTLQGEEYAEGVSIQIINSKDGTLTDFCITLDSGYCSFNDLNEGTYEVRAQYFGYRDTMQIIQISKDSQVILSYELKPMAYDLPNVSVIDKIIGMKRRGDTLQYNLKAYTTNNEKTLGDIISQLPGMQIDQEGNVLVLNKKADALLIEGRELVNEQHKLATEGLQSDLVATIELIENYKKEKEQFQGETENDKVAVNVRLKEEAKGTLSGNLQLYAGLPTYLNSEVNLFRATDKSGYSLYLRQNNTGEMSMEKPIYLALEELSGSVSGWKKLMRLEPMPLNLSYQSNASMPKGLVENEDYHFAINGDHDFYKKVTNRLYMTGSFVNRVSELNINRTYFDRNVTEHSQSRIQKVVPTFLARNEVVVNWNSRNFTELIIPVQWANASHTESESGIFNEMTFQQQNLQRRQSFSLHPHFEHSYKIYKSLLLIVSQDLSVIKNENDIGLTAMEPILGLPNSDTLNEYRVNQEFQYQKLQSNSGLELRKSWGKSYLLWKGRFDTQRERISADANRQILESIDGEEQLRSSSIQQSLQGRKDFGNGRFIVTLNHAWLQQQMNRGASNSGHYLLPYTIFAYEYASQHAFSISYARSLEFPNLLNTYHFNRVLGPRTLSTGNLDLEVLRRISSYNLSFFAPPLSGSPILYNINFSYSQLRKSFISNSIIKQDYVVNEFIETPIIERLSIKLYVSKFFDQWSFIFQTRGSFEDGYASREGVLVPLPRWQSNNSLLLRSKQWGNWSVASKLQHNYIRQTLGSSPLNFHNLNISLQTEYNLKDWAFDTEIIYNAQSTVQMNNNLWIINAEVLYSLNSQWRFFLQGNNILNLQSTDLLEAGFHQNYSEVNTYPTFPGQVLIGLGYYF